MNKINKKYLLNIIDILLFTFPAFFSVLLVTNIPFLMNIYYSFFNWNGISKSMKYVGLENFIKIFTEDDRFWRSSLFTLNFAIFFVIAVNVIAILFSLVLAEKNKILNIIRSFFFMPHIISLVAISLIWKFIFGPGFQNLFDITKIPLFGLSWLGEPNLTFYSTVFVTIWQNVGFYTIIYIAGLMAVPEDILEAASLDGANKFTILKQIKIPLLMPSITICIFHSLTYSFKLFDIILVLTKGGPADSTVSVAYNIYKEAFLFNKYGMATAKSLIFFVAVLIVTLIQLKFFKAKEVEY